jgi:hypothetical protein
LRNAGDYGGFTGHWAALLARASIYTVVIAHAAVVMPGLRCICKGRRRCGRRLGYWGLPGWWGSGLFSCWRTIRGLK